MKRTAFVFVMMVYAAGMWAQGIYVEFKLTAKGSDREASTKIYYSDGNSRAETRVNLKEADINHIAGIVLRDSGEVQYALNLTTKTYTVLDIADHIKAENDPGHYDLRVVGQEKVNGYNCTHLKMKKGPSNPDDDIWVSTDVPNYKQYINIAGHYISQTESRYISRGLFRSLSAKKVSGFPVRIIDNEGGAKVQVDLVKAELRNISSSLFSIEGYVPATKERASDIK